MAMYSQRFYKRGKNMKNKIVLLFPVISLLLSSTGYSLEDDQNETSIKERIVSSCCETPKPICEPCKECEICPPCETCEPCCCTEVPLTGEPCNCAYNAPARIDPACGWDAWLSASFIYWQAKESGLLLGFHYSLDSSGFLMENPIEQDFDYKPGFKVGCGISFCRDDWTLYLEYTRLQGENKRTFDLGNDFNKVTNYLITFLEKVPTSYFMSNIQEKWKISYNIFDLELGRPYYLGRKLVFKPYYGLRGGWIDQKLFRVSDGIHNDLSVELIGIGTENTWLIGPRIGVDTDWLIGCHFKMIGNAAASLCYQNFDTFAKSISQALSGAAKEKISALTPNVEFAIGLGYGSYFCNNQWYFDLSCAYDFHYFWNQNRLKPLKDGAVFLIESDQGDLMLHGLTITAALYY